MQCKVIRGVGWLMVDGKSVQEAEGEEGGEGAGDQRQER